MSKKGKPKRVYWEAGCAKCDFTVTGRSLKAVHEGLTDHHEHKHADEAVGEEA